MQNVGKPVDEVRRGEHQSLSLKESMKLFRNNPENLDADQSAHLDELKQANLITDKAYQMRLNLQEIYNLNSVECFKRKPTNGAIGCNPMANPKATCSSPWSRRPQVSSTTSRALSASPVPGSPMPSWKDSTASSLPSKEKPEDTDPTKT